MKRLEDDKMKLVVFGGLVAFLACSDRAARADFTFGEPTNLGPTVNTTSGWQGEPSISADGLALHFTSGRSGGSGDTDIWVTTRSTKDDPWGPPENLGPVVNSSAVERGPSVTADGLELYFSSKRTGRWELYMSTRPTKDDEWSTTVPLPNHVSISYGLEGPCISPNGLELYFATGDETGYYELYVASRATTENPWRASERLGPNINHAGNENSPYISPDGLALFFWSGRRLWMTTRSTTSDLWSPRIDLDSKGFSASSWDFAPSISNDGSIFYFESDRPGSIGAVDIWQAPIVPIVDFTGDGHVDIKDLIALIEHWGQNVPSLDMGPVAWGDGVIDTADLEVLMRYWGQKVYDPHLIAHWMLDETEGEVAYDSAGENDAAVFGDATWMPETGYVDGALNFNGMDGYIQTPRILNPADGPFSVFAWIKGGNPDQVILSQEGSTDWLLTDAQGCLMTALQNSSGRVKSGPLASEAIITDNNWHRIGFVRDGSDRVLYVDDIEVTRDTVDPLDSASGSLYIGTGSHLEADTFWSGMIDDVRIYDRVVTP